MKGIYRVNRRLNKLEMALCIIFLLMAFFLLVVFIIWLFIPNSHIFLMTFLREKISEMGLKCLAATGWLLILLIIILIIFLTIRIFDKFGLRLNKNQIDDEI